MTSRPTTIERWLLASVALVSPTVASLAHAQPPNAPAMPAPTASPPTGTRAPATPQPQPAPPPPVTAQLPDVTAQLEPGSDDEVSDSGDETIEIVDKAPPGARAELTKEALERDEYDDLHKVLRGIAGVY